MKKSPHRHRARSRLRRLQSPAKRLYQLPDGRWPPQSAMADWSTIDSDPALYAGVAERWNAVFGKSTEDALVNDITIDTGMLAPGTTVEITGASAWQWTADDGFKEII